MVYEKLYDVIEDIFAADRAALSPETNFADDLFADYEDMLELSMIVEEEFGVFMDDEVFTSFQTIGEFAAYIERHAGE